MTRYLSLLFFLPLLIATSSCVKEGCTDEEAINYDAEADDDDGSCVYKDTLRREFKEDEREVVKFSLDWSLDSNAYKGYQFGTSLEGKSVLLYMKHPKWVEEWTSMPFTHDQRSYYYTEHQDNKTIYVYIEDIKSGKADKFAGITEHKAVILTNEYMKENPEVEDMDYPEAEAHLDLE